MSRTAAGASGPEQKGGEEDVCLGFSERIRLIIARINSHKKSEAGLDLPIL